MSGTSILLLRYTRSDGEVDTYHLKPVRRYHVGRGSACEIRILDMKMSRQHCALEFGDDRWRLVDLGSTNGIRLNGEKVREETEPLEAGSLIQVGGSKLSVVGIEHMDGDAAAPAMGKAPGADAESPSLNDDGPEVEVDAIELADAPAEAAAPQAEENTPLEQEALPEGSDEDNHPDLELEDDWEPEPDSEQADEQTALEGAATQHSAETDDDDGLAPTDAAKQQPAAPIAADATPAGQRRTESGRVKPITIRVGTGAEHRGDDSEAAEQSTPSQPSQALEPAPDDDQAGKSAPAPESTAQNAGSAVRPVTLRVHQGGQENVTSANQPDDSADATLYITLLGRKVGPLTKVQARELKARELRGTLTEADLADYPVA